MEHSEFLEDIRKIILEKDSMHKLNNNIVLLVIFLFYFVSCKDDKVKKVVGDSPQNGTIEISVDESFEPVIREQIAMYEASNPGTKINAQYKSEAACLKDFFNDSVNRMVIVTRGLTDKEEKYMISKIGFNPGWNAIASDAVAIVININSKDTLFTMESLQQQLLGKVNKNQTLVFDGISKTSTARFVQDSVLKGQPYDTAVVRAVKNSDEVLEYVATHPTAIGFVGINRIGNPENIAQVAMLKRVKLAYLRCDICQYQPYILPAQETILNRRYPLVRGLYYLIKENYKGLGGGFVAFLKYERGQLIFRRAYLGPTMNFMVRNVHLNKELPKD
jgi:phosphate transport system substrate-binding protein